MFMKHALANRISLSWQTKLFSHLVRLPLSFFEKRSDGDILSRFDASEVVRRTITGTFADVIMSGAVTILTLVAMFFYSGLLAGIVILGATLYLGIRHAALGKMREAAMSQSVSDAELRTNLMETLHGIRPLKLFNKEAQRTSRWLNILVDSTNARSKVEGLRVWVSSGSTSILRVEMAAVIGIGAYRVLHHLLSLGELFAFLAYKDQFNAKILALINGLYDIGALTVQLDRISDVVRERPEEEVDANFDIQTQTETLDSPSASIEFRSLWFRYSDSDPWIIQELSLTIWPGECIAITGRSGSGKSTIVKLLSGLLMPTRGEIFINGSRVTGSRGVERQSLGVVLQDDIVFSGTIAENIHFFSETPDVLLMEECARIAVLDRDISAMPMRYETPIGATGTGISGGQRQRLLIARALYRKPSILIFDESTRACFINRYGLKLGTFV
jgi:ATP-binding cassette, subfamily B, bacterial CvaB/MchF/RaxB